MSIDTFLESLSWRYATKSFDSSKKVSKELLNKLLEALILAPSSYGLQPWKFFVVENLNVRMQLKELSRNQSQITECSHLIILASKTSIDADYINSYVNQIARERNLPPASLEGYRKMMLGSLPMMQGEAGRTWMTKQVYLALGVLLSACANARVDCCPMEGFDAVKYDEILGLSAKGFNARVLCPIGYRNEEDKSASMKKIRFTQSEVTEFI